MPKLSMISNSKFISFPLVRLPIIEDQNVAVFVMGVVGVVTIRDAWNVTRAVIRARARFDSLLHLDAITLREDRDKHRANVGRSSLVIRRLTGTVRLSHILDHERVSWTRINILER